MASILRLKIVDNSEVRTEIEKHIELVGQVELARWAISAALHVLHFLDTEFPNNETIANGVRVNEVWQKGDATVHQVRQAGFKIHEVARKCKSESAKASARAAGHAVSVGHMREHAILATDYAIKAIGLAYHNDMDSITQERRWQLTELLRHIPL